MTAVDEDVVLPALLRVSRGAYARAIIAELAANGFEDVPRNGSYVLGGIVNHGGASDLVRQLGVSKQAASQLIDVLVLRGYLQREVDPGDRRRLTVTATGRGRAAAAAIGRSVASVEDELATLMTPDQLAGLRAGLIALCDIRDRLEDETVA